MSLATVAEGCILCPTPVSKKTSDQNRQGPRNGTIVNCKFIGTPHPETVIQDILVIVFYIPLGLVNPRDRAGLRCQDVGPNLGVQGNFLGYLFSETLVGPTVGQRPYGKDPYISNRLPAFSFHWPSLLEHRLSLSLWPLKHVHLAFWLASEAWPSEALAWQQDGEGLRWDRWEGIEKLAGKNFLESHPSLIRVSNPKASTALGEGSNA